GLWSQGWSEAHRALDRKYASRIPPHFEICRPARLHAGYGLLSPQRRLRVPWKGGFFAAKNVAGRKNYERSRANPRGGQSRRVARPGRRRFFLRAEMVVRGSQKQEAHLSDLQRR